MKLSLVVAQGVHSGKVIPVTATEFVIGRDPQCQLRPASPAVSKQHCALSVRDGKVYVRDCGSTNGTFINNEQVAAEREVKAGDRLRVGPLEFDLTIEVGAPASKSSPVIAVPAAKPGSKPSMKPAGKPSPAAKAAAAATDTVPEGATVIMDPPVAKSAATATTVVESAGSGLDEDPDHLAALLLGLDDPTGSTNPTLEQMSTDPTTVMEMPALGSESGQAKKAEPKKENADSSSAAAEILSKYMRRPRT
jgi:predicted component of type VI protein secretion system